MRDGKPRVSIGLPVYNGGEPLRAALDSLLAQTETSFELIISDNASTDGVTPQIINEYAHRDPRIVVYHQPVNRGAFANFVFVVEMARSDYFVWAAHDDHWSSNYVCELADCLDVRTTAVLATPETRSTRTRRDGRVQVVTTPAAPGGDRWQAVEAFFEHQACCWIYGMFRRDWLREHAEQLSRYPLYSGDLIWLYELLLTNPVTGTRRATYFRDDHDGKYDRLLTARYQFQVYCTQLQEAWRITRASLPRGEQSRAFGYMRRHVYRRYITRGHVLGTAVRLVKLACQGAWYTLTPPTAKLPVAPSATR